MIKPGVLIGCKKCVRNPEQTNQDKFILEEFEKFDVLHCPHVDMLQRIYFPKWESISKDNGEETTSGKEKPPKSCA